ncbi:ATP-dependent zinc metalloprotease FtsH [Fulvivirga sedimenti]|uniref:ATP-dependent zinc metalloprotease FtsH n=1 Tax=Fulvivirga sedimenti TaxID=2879465 RepID=A0A9X1HWJ0_9BACT|nr:ATP-dependent zinc metalloprotease FtsH [Fulvivirga sedimenti]MCA6078685.1 ATP-dependent zinc metalloprotease FtsH [Fulvivirga sedimenti]
MPVKKHDLKNPKKPAGISVWLYLLMAAFLGFIWFTGTSSVKEITWNEFRDEMLMAGDVARVDIVNNLRAEVYIKKDSLQKPQYHDLPSGWFGSDSQAGPHYFFNIGSVEVFHENLKEAQAEMTPDERISVTYSERQNWWTGILAWTFPLILIFAFWYWMWRGSSRARGMGDSFNFGKSKARVIEKGQSSKVTFADVAGLEEAKEEIYELVKFLKDPGKYTRLGAKIPKGILLIGPPGTGKTLLAKAVAGEAGVPFLSLSGSEFIEMFVGVGAARMRDLFEKAKSKAPSIIFIDEIDTIGRARGRASAFQANDERESTLNQLLAELDGFDTDAGVIVLAATNRGDILDPALLRPGRFDRHIHLELPTLAERKAIFDVHIIPIKTSKDVITNTLASQTPGFSGADIANICNEAALIAARREKEAVEKQDFMDAIDRVVGGLEKRSKIISAAEKQRIAFHESGHVLVSWFLPNAHPVQKVSIIPRGRSLGAAWYLPEEHQVITRSEFYDQICTALGGRAAEEVVYGDVSTNALDDLEKVTKLAYNMVLNYGLGGSIRNLSFYDSTGRSENSLQKPYSEKTAERIDEEVQSMVDEAYGDCLRILQDNRESLDRLASELIKKEVIYREELIRIIGKKSPGEKVKEKGAL